MDPGPYANEELAWSTVQALELYLGSEGPGGGDLAHVARAAHAHAGRGVPLLDLLQVGILALGDGGDVERALDDAVKAGVRTVTVSEGVAERERELGLVEGDLARELGRAPHEWELADRAGLSLAQARAVRQAPRGGPGAELRLALDEHALADVVSALPAEERAVLELRYGIGGRGPHTLQEVAVLLELPRAEILALEEEALERLAVEREIRALLTRA